MNHVQQIFGKELYEKDHDHDHHHHHHLVAQPVNDVEGVEEALRRLWVKEGSKVTVGISCKPCLISGFVERRISQNTTDLSHEREELGEVVFLEQQQHGDLVPAGEGGKLPSEITEAAHWLSARLSENIFVFQLR